MVSSRPASGKGHVGSRNMASIYRMYVCMCVSESHVLGAPPNVDLQL